MYTSFYRHFPGERARLWHLLPDPNVLVAVIKGILTPAKSSGSWCQAANQVVLIIATWYFPSTYTKKPFVFL